MKIGKNHHHLYGMKIGENSHCLYPAEACKKMKVKAAPAITLSLALVLSHFAGLCLGSLQEGFYRGKCGVADVEFLVAGVVTARFVRDSTIVAALLRLQFHDCFVTVS